MSHANPRHYQPTNITFGIMEPIDDRSFPRMRAADGRKMSRKETRKFALSERALADLERWMDAGETVSSPEPFDELRGGPFDKLRAGGPE